jgi:hypothetical protein
LEKMKKKFAKGWFEVNQESQKKALQLPEAIQYKAMQADISTKRSLASGRQVSEPRENTRQHHRVDVSSIYPDINWNLCELSMMSSYSEIPVSTLEKRRRRGELDWLVKWNGYLWSCTTSWDAYLGRPAQNNPEDFTAVTPSYPQNPQGCGPV